MSITINTVTDYITIGDESISSTTNVITEVVEVGIQGPAGPTTEITEVYTAEVPTSGHTAVAINETGLVPLDINNPMHVLKYVGISLNAAALGDSITIKRQGVVTEPSWAWTPDSLVYAGLNGVLTQTLPEVSAFTKVVGVAIAPTKILLSQQPSILGV